MNFFHHKYPSYGPKVATKPYHGKPHKEACIRFFQHLADKLQTLLIDSYCKRQDTQITVEKMVKIPLEIP